MAHCGSREVLIVGGVGCNIENPLDKDDWSGYDKLTKGTDIQIVGNYVMVTNPKRIQTAIEKKYCNSKSDWFCSCAFG